MIWFVRVGLVAALGGLVWTAPIDPVTESPARPEGAPACDTDNGGLRLPPGFCAILVANDPGAVRHLAVAPNGDIFAATVPQRSQPNGGGLFVLRDTTGDGKVDVVRRISGEPGTGVALAADAVYFSPNDKVLRFPWRFGALEPLGPADTIVRDLPTGGHTAKPVVLGPNGALFVTVGSRTNSCQVADRQPRSPGHAPCTELESRAGIWRFDARKVGQRQADGVRVTTGVRNALSISLAPDGKLYAAVHGRDQLSQNWGFSDTVNAETPAEEFGPMEGADYGWPYCYYDRLAKRKVKMPEYGGDGQTVGDCDTKTQPAVAFPAHWAPNASVFYVGAQFPAHYRNGAFIAFHGSWNRAPMPQEGYRVAFVPFDNGTATGAFEPFAAPSGAPTEIRPSGVAIGPDGSLYIGSDQPGRIWRVMYIGR